MVWSSLESGKAELSFEAGGDEWEFVFSPRQGIERSFEIEVKGREYLIELEAGRGDERGLLEAEVEITPLGRQHWPGREAELELETKRGDDIEGSLEFRGLEFGLEAEAVGSKYLVEVEIENEKSGRTFEREFWVNPQRNFEKEFKVEFGGRVFELEIETETDRREDAFEVALEIEELRHDDLWV